MESVKNNKKEDCCGCTACFSVCPTKAITMKKDEEGFLYPKVDENKCISCGKCKNICPLLKKNNFSEPLKYLAVKNKDCESRLSSSSGGMFSILVEYIKEKNGIVYGAIFDEDFVVYHKRSDPNIDDWEKIKGSKYVQSDLKNTFSEVKQDLMNGKVVLYTGTPCSISGLKKYLQNINTQNLITCDIVCHGVPSPKVWNDYLKYVSKKYNTQIGNIQFRNKEKVGWHNSTITVYDKNNNIILKEKHNENYYSLMYFNNYILRLSCHECKYSNFNRPGDITLGDYWGIEKKYSNFDDDKGVSLVLVNTEKGLDIWNLMKEKVEYIEIKQDECIQPNLCSPSVKNSNREKFWKAYNKLGFVYTGKRFRIIKSGKMFKLIFLFDRIKRKIKKYFC